VKGFYSPIDQLAAQLPRTKGTGAEFMTELSKRPGYKPQEAQDRELQTLMALPKMERAQFLESLKAKPAPQLEETTLNSKSEEPTKYQDYSLPGGSNYREILLQMPHDSSRRVDPASGHWDQPNVLAHVRVKDRMIPGKEGYTLVNKKSFNKSQHFDTAEEAQAALQNMPESLRPSLDIRPSVGPKRKVLHIEEIQSDWHQRGRDKGYLPPDMSAQIAAAKLAHQRLKEQLEYAKSSSSAGERKLKSDMPLYQDPVVRQRVEASIAQDNNSIMDLMPQVMKAEAARQELEQKAKTGVPDAPFKKNWHELALKKMIHHAAANGYDSIAITPGAEQADRYSLAKHINGLQYDPQSKHLIAAGDKGEAINKIVEPHELPSYIGKEVTERLLSTLPLQGRHHLTGINLQTGGEGMKGFYDKIIPSFLNQFGKKYGAQVGTMPLPVEDGIEPGWVTKPAAPRTVPVHHFPITPEMREDVVKNGVPLYAKGGEVKPVGYTKEKVTVSPNLDQMRYEMVSVKRFKKAK